MSDAPTVTWKLRYTIEPGEWKREDVETAYQGLADSILMCSVVGGRRGQGTSHGFYGVNGHTNKPMDDAELFKAWVMLADKLADSNELSPEKAEIAAIIKRLVTSTILGIKGIAP